MHPTVLILASGLGLRFRKAGGQTHKLQADLAGRPVLERTIEAVRATGLRWHLEQTFHPGMGETIAAAVRATRQAAGWLVLPADMPLISPQTIRQVADAIARGAEAAQPVMGGQRGHPVGFAAGNGEILRAMRGDEGARFLLATIRQIGKAEEIEVDDPGILEDIDTPADLERVEALWRARQARHGGLAD
ncbi:NTP transferase domain-containing protein [Xylophilus sp. GOD-11R]|uniref:nucleotidyltransferase family protein n=1 Tax=Xylophilus sp. GOD-11R TaxID=3089814 RepID=UPI00298CCFAB|nr:NTP transferase domain-containing protein [Xylophilus sp. GOD-11R]WPB58493.1 NTP transferase domain-containing protein [Xylophilus sp. GOD-11R]